jgi:uncharacterized protein YjbJ (UPF0337 family)
MGLDDKVRNAADDIAGKAKEATGKVTDNERLEAEGKTDQVGADARKAGGNRRPIASHERRLPVAEVHQPA